MTTTTTYAGARFAVAGRLPRLLIDHGTGPAAQSVEVTTRHDLDQLIERAARAVAGEYRCADYLRALAARIEEREE